MRLLFIDDWPEEGAVYVYKDSISGSPDWVWNYDTFGAFGEEACGRN
jgi:hypothetical protein